MVIPKVNKLQTLSNTVRNKQSSCNGRVQKHFMTTYLGVSFCVMRNSLNLIETENKNVRAQFSKYFKPLFTPFFNIWSYWLHLHHRRKIPLQQLYCHVWWILDKIFSQKLEHVSRYLLLKKISCAHIIYIKSCSWFGIITNSQCYRETRYVKIFLNTFESIIKFITW